MFRTLFRSIALVSCLSVAAIVSAEPVSITKVEPTVFFPKVAEGQPLKQTVRLHLNNPGAAFEGQVKVAIEGEPSYTQDLGPIAAGASVREVCVLDRSQPVDVTFEVYKKDVPQPVVVQKATLQPQKKLTIYFVSYSHHDLGFADYPHRIRTNIRHANIERPLEFCRLTDSWDFDDRYRFMIETSEPITSFLASHSPEVAAELAGRIREGRIQIGALHNTANTGQLSHECMARLFYLTNRHCRDLLDVPPSKTAQIDDVIGLTWPLATFCKAAGVENLFHGYNPCGITSCMQPANEQPVFNWQGPDGQSRVLVRHEPYGAAGPVNEGRVAGLVGWAETSGWPWDILLMMDGNDYALADLSRASAIRSWNTRYAYPHVIYSTQDMFFDALAARKEQTPIRTFEGDANNEWASMDSGDARLLAQVRLAGEMIPTAEKFSTIASVLTPGGYPWTDIYQAYHRLLLHHEHTDGAVNSKTGGAAGARYYETELEENREMGRDALFLGRRALGSALDRLASAIATDADRTLVVFNPLGRSRSDLVRLKADLPPGAFRLVDSASGKTVPHQSLNGGLIFMALDVPAMGYKTFRVEAIDKGPTTSPGSSPADSCVLENRFYRIRFDAATGGIVSIHDKELDVELVDGSAPQQFNEYLYENFRQRRPKGNVWYRPEKASLARSAGPVARVMAVSLTASGARNIQQQVILYEDSKRIDFVLSMDKSPSGMTLAEFSRDGLKGKEAVYVSLPFAVPDFSIHHELPGAVIEPYRQQFTGSCTAYYPVRHFSDISNDKFGVTVSALDSSLIEYGHPRSCPMQNNGWHLFDTNRDYPQHSRMYLYLMNNMWNMNLQIDQRGPQTFRWSMRSHAGNWRMGQADRFGWDIHNPLMPQWIQGKQKGPLPSGGTSFVSIEPANVVCTTIKPAEHNGSGLILRFVETSGKVTEADVTLPLLDGIVAATETNLVEDDKPASIEVVDDKRIRVAIPAFGVKTIRVLPRTPAKPVSIERVTASAVSDMEIALSWQVNAEVMKRISHFNVYRGNSPDFKPTLLHLVQRSPKASCVDRPKLYYGGWINNRLEPDTTYYYRIAAVDRWNNQGPISKTVVMKTLKSEQKNMTPLRVEQLSAISVSPVAPYNSINLIFRTACESDISHYEIHRAAEAGFSPDESTRIGVVKSTDAIVGKYRVSDYDHVMFADSKVEPEKTYYYKVCAVDTAGNRGPYSDEAGGRTGQDPPYVAKAQSVWSPQYGPQNAIDGNLHWSGAWVPARYGGGSKEQPKDVWLSIELTKPIEIKGIKLVGDERDICWPKNYQVFYRQGKEWHLGTTLRDAKQRTTLATWDRPIETDGVKLFVSADDLPRYDDPQIDGALIVCELLLVLPDGTEKAVPELFP